MKRNKRGFTLIELLAVIVILAIIALIATPIILDIIKDSKESAIKQNAVAMASVAEKRCMSLEMNKENRAFRVEYEDGKEKIGEGLSSLEGTFKGDNPSYGQIDVNDRCDVAMALYDNSTQLCVYKEHNNDKILSVKTSKIDTCNVDNIKEGIFPMPDEDSDGNDDDIEGDEVVVIPPIDVGFSCGEVNPEDVDPTLFTYTDNADGTVTIKGVASGVTLPTDLKIPCYNPDGKMITAIGSSALSSKKLTSVLMGDNVKVIGDYSFQSNSIKTLELGNSVETIGYKSFYGNKIEELVLPDSLINIDGISEKSGWQTYGAFSSNQLKSVVFGSGIEKIGSYAFYNNPTLTNVDFSRATNLKTIEAYAFYEYSLNDLNLTYSNQLSKIGVNAFASSNLNNVAIKGSDLSLNSTAFMGSKITNVNIESNTLSISENAFKDNLINELNMNSKSITLGKDAFKNNKLPENESFFVEAYENGEETSTVLTSYGGENRNNISIPNNITSFTGTFGSLGLTGTLNINDIVEVIPDSLFAGNQITKLSLGDNVKTIGRSAFQSNAIKKIEFGNNLETIEYKSFYGNKIEELVLPDSLINIDGISESSGWQTYGAFDSNQLKSVVFGSGIEKIGSYAFYNNPNLISVDFSRATNLKTIEAYAFYKDSLTTVSLNSSNLTKIGNNAFASNPNLASITIIGKAEGDSTLSLGSSWNGTCTNIVYSN